MAPKEALKVLDDILSQISTSREGHKKIEEAIFVLRVLVEKEEKK